MARTIPRGWKELEVKDFLKFTPREVEKPKKPYLSLGIRSHCKGTFIREVDNPDKVMMDTLYAVKENDFIVNITFAWEGAVALVKKSDEGALVSHRFPTYVFDRNVVIPEYFRYLISSKRFISELGVISPGGAGRNRVLDRKDFMHLRFVMPPIAEQNRIAEILTIWDRMSSVLMQLILRKASMKRGLISKLLMSKLMFSDDKWKKYEFCQIGELLTEKYDPKKETNFSKCVELENLSQETGRILGSTKVDEQSSTKNIFYKGNVLFGKLRPYLRKYALAKSDGICSSEVWVLRSNPEICIPEYLFYLIQSHQFIQKANATCGTKMPRADWDYLSDELFILPTITTQRKIVKILQCVDKENALLDKKLQVLNNQKLSLMQKLLTGKIRAKA